MKPHLHISVRELVDHTLRSGDLEKDFFGTGRSAAGIRVHQRIQQSRPETYQREVPVSYVVETEVATIELSGRIDGVFSYPETVLEEIKTTQRSLEEIQAAANDRHWAQLKIYAYLYAGINSIQTLKMQLTYCHLLTGDILEIEKEIDKQSLECFFCDLMNRYLKHVAVIQELHAARDLSIQQLEFPYPDYRPGQRDLAVLVYRAIKGCGQLLLQAPTGIGKTIAVLYPAVKAMAEKKAQRIFYLTARSTGKTVAEETLAIMGRKGLRLKCVVLTAREKICFNPGSACTGEECEFARGYYDRLNTAMEAAVQNDIMNREIIEALALSHRICPFEFSLELALWADCIIGDYNYVFDPHAYLKQFFHSPASGNLFLIDEAHNLVGRSRDMYSAELWQQEIRSTAKAIKRELPVISQHLRNIDSWLRHYKKASMGHSACLGIPAVPDDLVPLLSGFVLESDGWLFNNTRHMLRELILDLYFKVIRFLKVAELFGEGIDLLGDRLTGAVVVSVGQPPPSPERELIQNYFEQRNQPGFEFAYVFPGFNRVLQACGRVIRSETDRGSVLLMDRRYSTKRYTALFPPSWRPTYISDMTQMTEVLRRFWDRRLSSSGVVKD